MKAHGCVVVPRDLLERISNSNQKCGWFSGLKLEAEGVLVAIQCNIGNEEVESTNPRMLPHRASNLVFGRYEQQLLQWTSVEAGFNKKYAGRKSLSEDDYRAVFGLDPPTEGSCFAAVEPGDDGPILTAKVAKKSVTGRVRLLPNDSIMLEPEATPFARLPSEIVQDLRSRSVMIVGVGSGGSEIALNLACSGIGRLDLVDSDRLRPENYIRFPTGKQELGRHKVDVVSSMIHERELPTEVGLHHLDVVTDADQFRGLLSPSIDLLICATDSTRSRRLVNCTAVQMRIPCIIAGTLNNGRIAEVLRISPFESACYECVRLELGAVLEEEAFGDRPITPYVGPEEMRQEGAALRMDITIPAALASNVAIQVLNPAKCKSAPTPYILWGREANMSLPPPFQFEYPFATNFVPVKKRKDCPVCGALPAELVGVDVPQRVREILAKADQASQ
jgi:molybdopterin/thiamine biosynthesis adenylyltransferase